MSKPKAKPKAAKVRVKAKPAEAVLPVGTPPPHEHHTHPSRCCVDEPASAVLERLVANPPIRSADNIMRPREAEDQWQKRLGAYQQAVAREQALVEAGK